MRELRIDLNDSQHSYEAGYTAEHNATNLYVLLTDELFNSESDAFVIRFANKCGFYLSKPFAKSAIKNKTISLSLWQELTRDENLIATVEGYKNKSLIMKSKNIKMTFEYSVNSAVVTAGETEADSLLQDIVIKNTIIDESESVRMRNETERIGSENARLIAEVERIESEVVRKETETERVEKERERLSAESIRTQNETARQEAEIERVENDLRVQELIGNFIGDMVIANTVTPGAVKSGGDISVSSAGIMSLSTSIKNALKKMVLEACNPVGTIHMFAVATNPATLLGFGTWAQIAKGRTIVGVDTADSDFNSIGKQGGAKTHKLTGNEMPKHAHQQSLGGALTTVGASSGVGVVGQSNTSNTSETGGDMPHNNLPPYECYYIWKRTA